MNTKRIAIATVIGFLCGLFCAYGTIWITASKPTLVVTTGLLAVVVYNRVLLGLFVGLSDDIPLHPVLRGALIGVIVSLAISLMNMIDVGISDSAAFIGFGIVYGIIADVVATRFS